MVTGTQIANEILEMYKKFCDVSLTVAVFERGALWSLSVCSFCLSLLAQTIVSLVCYVIFRLIDWSKSRFQERAAQSVRRAQCALRHGYHSQGQVQHYLQL